MGDPEYKCRRCGNVVSSQQYIPDQFCPHCGTFLSSRHRLRHWMFQFNPAMYAWFDWIKENRETEQWLTSRYARRICMGDKAAIWASGKKAGVYAVGEIVKNPEKRPLNAEQEKYWANKDDILKFLEKPSVIIKYSKAVIDRPLLEDVCSKDPVLSEMAVLMQPQGTNFQLSNAQWHRILELIDSGRPRG